MTLSVYEILLVEDDSNDILFIQRAFRQANIRNSIHIVRNGDDAVAYLAGEGKYISRETYPLPLLILLDLKLPCRSGLEVLEWLKEQPILKRIPVVILTSSKESIDVNHAYDLGVNCYLLKPVRFDALIKMVEAIDTFWLQLNQYPSI
jgi:CheY-like chemotaxis protein